jgi:hypothetical protein
MDTIEMENNFPPDFLSQANLDFLTGFLEMQLQKEAIIIDQFLKEKS